MILKRILVLLVLHKFLIAKNAIIHKHAPNAKIIFIYQYQKNLVWMIVPKMMVTFYKLFFLNI